MPDFFRSKYINRNYKKAIQMLGGNICNLSKLHIKISNPILCNNSIHSILIIVNLNGSFKLARSILLYKNFSPQNNYLYAYLGIKMDFS